jgi:hypothetical protein
MNGMRRNNFAQRENAGIPDIEADDPVYTSNFEG